MDGEFSRVKDKYQIHLTRHIQDDQYIEVKDSETFCDFGNLSMAKPGPKSGIEKRTFANLDGEIIQKRSREV